MVDGDVFGVGQVIIIPAGCLRAEQRLWFLVSYRAG